MISQSSWQATRKATWRIVESLWKQKATKTATYNKYYSLPKWILGGATLWTAGTFLLTVAHAEQKTPQTAPSFMAPKQSQVGWDNVVKETRDVSKTLSPPMEMTLYQYAPCPYCNKVRAVCDYYSIPFRCVEVNPLTKKELQFSSYKKVPIAIINGQQINGSTDIVLTIQDLLHNTKNSRSVSPLTVEQKKWLDWLDDYFIHLLPPNIYRTPKEAVKSFDYILHHSKFTYWQQETTRWFGGLTMYLVAKRLKSKYNIHDERESLYEAVNLWCQQAVGDKSFCGGDQPGLTDLVMFGVLRSLEYYDVFEDIQANTQVSSWYQKMQALVGDSCMIPVEEE